MTSRNLNRDTKIDSYEEELEQAYEHYIAKVMEIAARARREMLVPWLKLTGCEFVQGNGTWLIYNDSKNRYLSDGRRDWNDYGSHMNDNLPEWLDRVMELEIEGAQGNAELSLWMIDYSARKTKNGGGITK